MSSLDKLTKHIKLKSLETEYVSLGVDLAKKLMQSHNLFEIYYILSDLQTVYDIFEKFEHEKKFSLIRDFMLPDNYRNYMKIKIGLVYISSLISCEESKFSCSIINISDVTQRGNYIHTITNSFNVEYKIALKAKAKQFDDEKRLVKHTEDFSKFVIHPCKPRNENWLYLDTDHQQEFTCKVCQSKVHTGIPAKKREFIYDTHWDKKLPEELFRTFFENNLHHLLRQLNAKIDARNYSPTHASCDRLSDEDIIDFGFNGDPSATWDIWD